MTACVVTPFSKRAIDTAYCGKPCKKLVVPSNGSIIQRKLSSPRVFPLSSAKIECFGKAFLISFIMAFSAVLSTSETKSLSDLFSIVSKSTWLWYLKITSPAALAALTAILTVGCMVNEPNK